MKTFKIIDYSFQILLILGALFFNLVNRPTIMTGDLFFLSYVIVGGWQVISVIVHFFIPAGYKIKLRLVYLLLLLITVIGGAVSWASGDDDTILAFFGVLLFWSPFLAILYTTTCILETSKLKQVAG